MAKQRFPWREIVLLCIVALFAKILVEHFRKKNEPFGTSPGTMVQLQSTHVPTEEDRIFYQRDYPKMVRREITELTEEDPGELRPWIFPWYGRGVVLVH